MALPVSWFFLLAEHLEQFSYLMSFRRLSGPNSFEPQQLVFQELLVQWEREVVSIREEILSSSWNFEALLTALAELRRINEDYKNNRPPDLAPINEETATDLRISQALAERLETLLGDVREAHRR